MRNFMLTLGALSLAIPVAVAPIGPIGKAEAHSRYYRGHHRVYHGRTRYYRYRGCRHSSGTTGLIAGGVGGALLGNSVLGHGALGTIAGGVGGAFAGRAIDRTITARSRCG